MNDIAKAFKANVLASVRTLVDYDSYSDGTQADNFTDDLIEIVAEYQDIALVLAAVEDKVQVLDAMNEQDIIDYVTNVMGKVVE